MVKMVNFMLRVFTTGKNNKQALIGLPQVSLAYLFVVTSVIRSICTGDGKDQFRSEKCKCPGSHRPLATHPVLYLRVNHLK